MFYVSRQIYYCSGEHVVEVVSGGRDYANADMLTPKFRNLGEGREYSDPRNAVAAAIAVCTAWRKYGEDSAKVAVGSTGGMGIELEGDTDETAIEWAERVWEKMPKCDRCGEVLPEKRKQYTMSWPYDEDGVFCSENCADQAYAAAEKENEEESED